ncbi:hypothetical protein [Bradyrhizobium uaiense]|uniref:Uncharacterized protein n=1 Tax=Bradyrhizobium uaiense TaxID=2594946 RepID=A0A6P1BS14_9BRAD|nr:hypothetical protein [Bradyrhizobium uaiense]NEV00994.1 hypothetical protein [Bradyrhizobium uaiense]
MQATVSTVPNRGTLHTVLHEDGRRVAATVPTAPNGSVFVGPLAGLADRLSNLATGVNVGNGQYLPAARAEALRQGVINLGVDGAFRAVAGVGQKERRDIASAKATAMEVPPATPATAAMAARTLVLWDRADIGGKANMLNTLPVDGLGALIASGAYREDGIPAELQQVAADRYMALNHVRRVGLQADHTLVADHNDPLATGPNVEAATNAARAAVKTLNARSETVESVSDALRSIISMVGLATDLSDQKAYQLLSTGSIA